MNTPLLASAFALLLASAPVAAQHAHHPSPSPPPPAEETGDEEETPEVDHAAMGHDKPEVDHSAMGHDTPEVDHVAMGHDMPEVDHAAMGHDTHGDAPAAKGFTPVPAPTAADRAAAVKPPGGHAAHGDAIHSYFLFDRLEAWRDDGHTAAGWEVDGWIGKDIDRLWLRGEGEHAGGRVESGDLELLYGRSVTPWWDLVAGVRHDFGEAPSQTFAAFGVQGLAPYKIELAATAYVGTSGQTALKVEAEYDTLLTNRLILGWVAEAEAYGRRDERRGIGAGLNTFEAGLRLRYEIRREFAPYVGVAYERHFGDAADWRRADGGDADDVRVVAGVRFWF